MILYWKPSKHVILCTYRVATSTVLYTYIIDVDPNFCNVRVHISETLIFLPFSMCSSLKVLLLKNTIVETFVDIYTPRSIWE